MKNGFKLKEGRFRLGLQRKFVTQRAVRPLALLPREAVCDPSVETLKARLNGALGSLNLWVGTLPTAQG